MQSGKENKRKILLVITKSNFGGAQRYVYDLSRYLMADHDITVACGGDGELVSRLKNLNVKVISIPGLGRDVRLTRDISSSIALYKIIKSERPDVLHLNSSKIGAMGAIIGRMLSVPRIIFTAHGWAWNENRGALSRLLIRFIYFFTILLSHEVVAVSRSIKNDASGIPLAAEKITVIHHGIESKDILDRDKARALLPQKARASKYVIGTVAELHHIKGLSYAIKAMTSLRDLDLSYVIWGEGDERKKLEEKIREYGLENRVFLPGAMRDAGLSMQAFDCFLLPSISEALGYVILEAGISGLPVIATAVGGIPEIISDMKSGMLIHPKNDREIVRAIRFFVDNPNVTKNMGNALKETVERDFSISRMVAETVRLYNR